MTIKWPDFKFPPINLLNFPKQCRDYCDRHKRAEESESRATMQREKTANKKFS